MNKIINGKKYDTATAQQLDEEYHYNSNGNTVGCTSFYRKKTGEFFLYYWANPRDIFSGNSYIKPLSEDEAKKYAEEHLSGEDYEKIFGEVAE
jgi:hypothetical protein